MRETAKFYNGGGSGRRVAGAAVADIRLAGECDFRVFVFDRKLIIEYVAGVNFMIEAKGLAGSKRGHSLFRRHKGVVMRRAKAMNFRRCNSYPVTVVPAGSNRSGGGGN